MSISSKDIYTKLIQAGIGDTPFAQQQLREACADMVGEKFHVDEFISNLLYRGEWHHTTQKKIRSALRFFNGETVEYKPRQRLNDLINSAQARGANAAQKTPEQEAAPPIWLTVYKDALGFQDDHDNLTQILVPEKWLMDCLRGTDTEEWFCEYTADDTDDIARKALSDGIILDCSNPGIKAALLSGEKIKSADPER